MALTLLLLASLAAVAVAPWLGATHLEVSAWSSWWAQVNGRVAADPTAAAILALRLPRVALGWVAGAGLAAAGAALQGLFRNPLATPYTTGVAAAAALGVAATLLLGLPLPPAGGLLLALGESALLALAAARSGGRSTETLLLAGVTLNLLAGAVILFFRALAPEPLALAHLDRWLMGGVEVVGFGEWLGLLPLWGAGVVALLLLAPSLDQLALGPEVAASRGVAVAAATASVLAAAAAITASVVAVAGPIAFVGLVVPHAVRPLAGGGHRRLLAGSLLAGGGFLVLCDAGVRLLARGRVGGELPVGAVTALIGAPLFLLLLVRGGRSARPNGG